MTTHETTTQETERRLLGEQTLRLRIPPSVHEQLLQVYANLDLSMLISATPPDVQVFAANLTFDDATGVEIQEWGVYDDGVFVVGRGKDGVALTIEATRLVHTAADVPEAAAVVDQGDKRLGVAIPTIMRNWHLHQLRMSKELREMLTSTVVAQPADWGQRWTNSHLASAH